MCHSWALGRAQSKSTIILPSGELKGSQVWQRPDAHPSRASLDMSGAGLIAVITGLSLYRIAFLAVSCQAVNSSLLPTGSTGPKHMPQVQIR
ncbi:uncharacterized protein LOC62_03G004268 [Vanrija pseudolonga]|uniref:Uncharacterized protein n=1 Tax=Vanrija pseudolonga TaxID=143232 RepID=A0AAF1BLE5_9TREE|nr:hypothetical protein LOC62_03G004268 [Vanrija pseudolonga]